MPDEQRQELVERFRADHQLPGASTLTIKEHFLPLAEWVKDKLQPGTTFTLGINGAQGTGKSTLADLIDRVLTKLYDRNVALLSLDDFYLTRIERRELANTVHPLLITRGVPGTHDTALLRRCLDKLSKLADGESMTLPRFDKAVDDRIDESKWPAIEGAVDLVILEGWCVGAAAEDDESLAEPINEFELVEDPAALLRGYANERLRADYEPIFDMLDALVFLQAPRFDIVLEWRLQQEHQLRARSPADAPGIMTDEQVARFVQFYERITRNNLQLLPGVADVVLEYDEDHRCISSRYRKTKVLRSEDATHCQ